MATIYRFIVEQKSSGDGGGTGRNPKTPSGNKKGAGKKTTSLFSYATSSGKGGVEHNRYLRAVNPVINKMTGGAWEKGMRLGRAGLGLVQVDKATGAFAGLSAVAIVIIVQMCINALLQWQQRERQKALKMNAQNFKMLENGVGAVRSEYDISVNMFNGRTTYNQNK